MPDADANTDTHADHANTDANTHYTGADAHYAGADAHYAGADSDHAGADSDHTGAGSHGYQDPDWDCHACGHHNPHARHFLPVLHLP
ncbi:MAG: hypothetical protein ABS910_02545 [Arthrobacter sp.]